MTNHIKPDVSDLYTSVLDLLHDRIDSAMTLGNGGSFSSDTNIPAGTVGFYGGTWTKYGSGTFDPASGATHLAANNTFDFNISGDAGGLTNGASIQLAAGSAAQPSITFTTSTTTGIYSSGTSQIAFSVGGQIAGYFAADKSFYCFDDITAFSDKRLKTELKEIDQALAKVKQLTGYTYTMNNKRKTGLIAQDVQAVLPEAVHTGEDDMLSLAYGNLVGLLVEAIKELDNNINEIHKKL